MGPRQRWHFWRDWRRGASGDEVGWTPTFYAVDGPGSRAVWLRVADIYGQVSYGVATLTITEEPNAPVVQLNGQDSVNEGGSVTLTATHSGDWSGDIPYAWDLDGNDTYTEGTGSSATFSANRPTRWYLVSVLAADAAGHRAHVQVHLGQQRAAVANLPSGRAVVKAVSQHAPVKVSPSHTGLFTRSLMLAWK